MIYKFGIYATEAISEKTKELARSLNNSLGNFGFDGKVGFNFPLATVKMTVEAELKDEHIERIESMIKDTIEREMEAKGRPVELRVKLIV